MVCFVLEDCGKRVGIQPWWRKDICASLTFEQQGEPERHIGSMGRIQRSYRSPKKLKTLESLAGYDGDELHFT